MDNRERDIQEMCRQVLDVSLDYWDDPNGPYTTRCIFCDVEYYGDKYKPWGSNKDLKHTDTCAWIIAKDLSTGYRKN